MNFEDLKKLENISNIRVTVSKKTKDKIKQDSEINKNLVAELIKSELDKKYSGKPFENFYEDVISELLKFKFKKALGENIYEKAEDDALACLELCEKISHLSPHQVHGWLMSALKFIDHFILHYIQDVKNLVPVKIGNAGDEKSRYIQVKGMKDLSIAGICLVKLLDIRNNKLEHRTRKYANGKQELLKPNRKAILNEVLDRYPRTLKAILIAYKKSFPVCCEK